MMIGDRRLFLGHCRGSDCVVWITRPCHASLEQPACYIVSYTRQFWM